VKDRVRISPHFFPLGSEFCTTGSMRRTGSGSVRTFPGPANLSQPSTCGGPGEDQSALFQAFKITSEGVSTSRMLNKNISPKWLAGEAEPNLFDEPDYPEINVGNSLRARQN